MNKIECPKCGKKAVIKSGLGYKCAECGFTWNINFIPILMSSLGIIFILTAIAIFGNSNKAIEKETKTIEPSNNKEITTNFISNHEEKKLPSKGNIKNKEPVGMKLPQSTTDLESTENVSQYKTLNIESTADKNSHESSKLKLANTDNTPSPDLSSDQALTLSEDEEEGRWQIASYHDSATDETIVTASVQSDNTYKDRWQDDRKADLMFRCKKGKIEAAVNFGITVACRGRSPVRYAIDTEKEVKEAWYASTNCVGLFSPQPVHLMKKLKDHNSLKLTFKPYMNDETTITFAIGNDFNEAFTLIERTCKLQ